MPSVDVVFYRDDDGTVPVADWIDGQTNKVRDKCTVRIERLRSLGHEMRRPEADYLKDGIYELRVRCQNVNYRILYFFHGRWAVVLAHGLVKEKAVPERDIAVALSRKARFESSPSKHTRQEA
jgi:phage-related protein